MIPTKFSKSHVLLWAPGFIKMSKNIFQKLQIFLIHINGNIFSLFSANVTINFINTYRYLPVRTCTPIMPQACAPPTSLTMSSPTISTYVMRTLKISLLHHWSTSLQNQWSLEKIVLRYGNKISTSFSRLQSVYHNMVQKWKFNNRSF